jgi:hypothetical protein
MITNIYIYGNDEHALDVYGSFCQGLADCGSGWTGSVVYGASNIATALGLGCQLYIKSYTGMSGMIAEALASYPDIVTFMPAGSNTPNDHVYNSNGILPNIIVTGAGITSNLTGYDIEFYSHDSIDNDSPDLSSFSNGYIAGVLTYITNYLNVNIWTARYLLRVALGNSWTPQNGYGKVTPQIAETAMGLYNPLTDYNALDPFIARLGTIGTITGVKTDQNVVLTLSPVTNATSYEIRKNGVLLAVQSGLTYTDALTASSVYDYRGKFTNIYGEVEYSEYSDSIEIKFCTFNTIAIRS